MIFVNFLLLYDLFDLVFFRISLFSLKLFYNWCEISGVFNCNGFNYSFINYVLIWILFWDVLLFGGILKDII